ncbi:EH signature domain-containing protein [Gracilimonas halophila]|uniref:EH signature domain-containing protein n=1 Tax=Gracilimonas halophila TaxID=1834464 RepID=A0ABW5JGQ4_9BACT
MLSREPVIKQWGDLSSWEKLAKKVDKNSTDLLKKVPVFQKIYTSLVRKPKIEEVIKILKNNPFAANVFVYLSRNDPEFYTHYLNNNEIIEHLSKSLKNSPTYSQRLFKLAYLENLYLGLSTKEIIVEKIILNLTNDEIISTSFLKEVGLLSNKPIDSFVDYLIAKGKSPKQVIQNSKIEISYSSQTFREIESGYILKRIDEIDLKKKSKLPSDLKRGGYFEVPYHSELLGHEILRRILRNLSSVDLHHYWIDLILDIASDPRSSKGSENYVKWWSKIDQRLINEFIKVLSHNDIILFLDAIEDFADETNNKTMQRMYESRKKLLKGLAIQGLIDESRLVLPKRAKRFIKQKRKNLDQSFIANLNAHQGLCVIYLRIGRLHIIEGSHNFAMRVFYDLNDVVDLMKPSTKSLTYLGLTNLDWEYENFTGRSAYNFTHDQFGRWKKKIIRLIQSEVEVDVNLLLTDEEFYKLNI